MSGLHYISIYESWLKNFDTVGAIKIVFFGSIWQMAITFSCFVLIVLIAAFLFRIPSMRKKTHEKLGTFRYNFFLRSFIQSFLLIYLVFSFAMLNF